MLPCERGGCLTALALGGWWGSKWPEKWGWYISMAQFTCFFQLPGQGALQRQNRVFALQLQPAPKWKIVDDDDKSYEEKCQTPVTFLVKTLLLLSVMWKGITLCMGCKNSQLWESDTTQAENSILAFRVMKHESVLLIRNACPKELREPGDNRRGRWILKRQDVTYEEWVDYSLSPGFIAGTELVHVFDRRRENVVRWITG